MRGELPRGWVWSTIGEVCHNPQYGWTTKATKTGSLRLVRTTDVTSGIINWDTVPFCEKEPDNKEKYLLKDGDIVISRAGSVGYSLLIKSPQHSVFASYLIRFMPLIDENFVAYFLKSTYYWNSISESKIGIAVPNVNATKLKQVSIPIAPLPEQQRIVAKIEELFTKLEVGVEALKQVQAQLIRYRQSVLKAAVEGRLTAEWREQHLPAPSKARQAGKDELEPADKLLERIQDERKAELGMKYKEPMPVNTSDLPELPEGWIWVSIETISDSLGGFAFKSKDYSDNGYQIVKIGNVKMNLINLEKSPNYIKNLNREIVAKYLLEKNDVLITLTGTRRKRDYGFVAIVKNEQNLLLNQRVARLRFSSRVNPDYYTIALQSEEFRDRLFANETGNVGQGNIGMGAITIEAIPLPTFHEQLEIINEYHRLSSIIDDVEIGIESELKRAQSLRQSILKRAFEGKLVPQDPNDLTASILLEKIKAEKAKQKKSKQMEML